MVTKRKAKLSLISACLPNLTVIFNLPISAMELHLSDSERLLMVICSLQVLDDGIVGRVHILCNNICYR